jgi:DNA repair protein RadC
MEKQLSIILGNAELAFNVCQFLEHRTTIPTVEELTRIRGVGLFTAQKILACMELSATYCVGQLATVYTTAEAIAQRFCHLKYEQQEHGYVLCLDSACHEVGVHEVSMGLANATPLHPREVFKHAIADNAIRIVLVHNHPSGSTEPSPEDYSITRVMIAAGKVLQIPLLDHIIVSRSGCTSLRAQSAEMFE